MPYAVDNAFFRERAEEAAPHRDALRAQFDLEPGRPVILFAAKLQPRKHCDHLLEAYLQLSSEQGAYLLIVGDGEERAALEARVVASGCQNVRFAGFRNQRELPGFFDLCTVFVLPSRHEPWGLTVNEAMNAARPAIVSEDVGCAPDLVVPGKTGWVYPTGDVAALRDALADVLRDPVRTAQMGRNARDHVAAWDYEADIRGLRAALHHTTRKIRR
jgi:glycosyltransferase involved in cell wall biosynthesis